MRGYKRHGSLGPSSSKHSRCSTNYTISKKRLIKKINSGEITNHDLSNSWCREQDLERRKDLRNWRWFRNNTEQTTGGYPTHGCVGKRVTRAKSKKYNRSKEQYND